MISAFLELLSDITGFEQWICLILVILNLIFYLLLFGLLAFEEVNTWRSPKVNA